MNRFAIACLMVSAFGLLAMLPFASASISDDGTTFNVGAEIDEGTAPSGSIPIAVSEDFPNATVHFVPIPTLPVVSSPENAVSTQSDSFSINSPGLSRTLSIPEQIGPWYDSSIHTSWAASEGTYSVNDGLVGSAGQFNTFLESLTPQDTHQAQTSTVGVLLLGIESAPQVSYHINTRHVELRLNDPGSVQLNESRGGAIYVLSGGQSFLIGSSPSHDQPTLTSTTSKDGSPSTTPLPGEKRAGPTSAPIHTSAMTTQLAGPASMAAFLGMAAAGGLVLSVLGLYSLFQGKEVLKSDIRRRIYTAIEQNPGITIVDLASIVGVKHQTVCYHLALLRKAGYVTAHQKGNKVQHFVNGAGFNDNHRELLAVGRDSATMRVLMTIVEKPMMIKKDVATAVGLTRTGGAWHVNKLVKLGLVIERKEHGMCLLAAVPERVALLMELTNGAKTEGETATAAAPAPVELVPVSDGARDPAENGSPRPA
jgi:predicted transcriptional regulator